MRQPAWWVYLITATVAVSALAMWVDSKYGWHGVFLLWGVCLPVVFAIRFRWSGLLYRLHLWRKKENR